MILKKLLKIFTVIICLSSFTILYMYFKEYNISELTPNIILTDLQKDKNKYIFNHNTTFFLEESILNSKFKSCNCNNYVYLNPDYALISANEILQNKTEIIDCCKYKLQWINNIENPQILISDKVLDVNFRVSYNKENIPYEFYLEPESLFNKDFSLNHSNVIKNYLDIILATNEFTLIRGIENKNNEKDFDFLIKDLGENFLIYTIPDHIENPQSIWFNIYKKQKYFNKFFK